MASADADGCAIDFVVEGQATAPPLLLSNSIGLTRELWRAQMPMLTRAFRVIRYDTRGHGASQTTAGEYTLERLGLDALAVLDAAGVERADICGLSLGGVTAMWLGLHAPGRVRRLVLANTGARIGTRERWQQRIDDVLANGLAGLAEHAPERWFTPGFRADQPAVVASLQQTLAGGSPAGHAACAAALRDTDLREALGQLEAEALVIAGVFDQATPPPDADDLCRHIPKACRVDLQASHLSNVEAAEPFTRAVIDFLTEQDPDE